MNWFNVSIGGMDKPDFTASSNAEVGIWLRLGCYCAQQENGGSIRNCREWTSRQWLISVGVEKEEISVESRLWRWDKVGGLILNHYPEAQEREVLLKRKAGQATAKRRWAKKMNGHETRVKDSSASSSASSSADAKGNSKGREYTISVDRYPELEPDSE